MPSKPRTAQDAPETPEQAETPQDQQAAVDAAVWAATHDADGNPKPITPGANPIVP